MLTVTRSPGSILVVDDDADIRDALAEVLREEGHDVLTARNGLEALERLGTAPLPCTVLLDLMMPVMNGEEFLERARARWPTAQVSVVVVTADQLPGPPGTQGLIRKPFDIGELLEAIAQVQPHHPALAGELGGAGQAESPRAN